MFVRIMKKTLFFYFRVSRRVSRSSKELNVLDEINSLNNEGSNARIHDSTGYVHFIPIHFIFLLHFSAIKQFDNSVLAYCDDPKSFQNFSYGGCEAWLTLKEGS